MTSLLENNRLVKTIYPTHYTLHINPNFTDYTFDGEVRINMFFEKMVNTFALNSKNLTIKSILFDDIQMHFSEDKENELLIIEFDENQQNQQNRQNQMEQGEHKLFINYTGTLNDNMEGFYRSAYTDDNGETKYLATTQFESTSARLALPCFDEPSFKATFDVSITTDRDYTVLSNCEIKYVMNYESVVETLPPTKTVYFETSPKMSTYLLAFIVGDLEYVEAYTQPLSVNMDTTLIESKRIRVYGTQGNKHKMQFSLDIGVRCLEWYIKWFGIDYPLPKLDMVAVPDFSAGAMENWGLVTYREGLLYCDENTDLVEKQDIAVTICHELAHQWFGNLVTMEWWTYLWLNESMATYFGWRVVDELFPEWKVWNKFNRIEYGSALELDSLDSSHPIEVQVKKTNEIQHIFDAISYSKGSCLIKFLANHLGEDVFRQGMIHYMNTNAYKNTESNDLWDAFDYVRNDPEQKISELMESWTKQKGYPVVIVNHSQNKLIIKQEKFLKQGPTTSDNTLWKIPLRIFITNGDDYVVENIMFENQEIDLSELLTKTYVDNKYNDVHILVNQDRLSLYRVKYQNVSSFEFANCTYQEITNILDDSFALAYSAYQKFSVPFGLINKLDLSNNNYSSFWVMLTGYLSSLDNMTLDTVTNTFVLKIISHYSLYVSKMIKTLGSGGRHKRRRINK